MEYHYSIEIRNTSFQAIMSEIERRNSDLPFESMWRFKRTAFIGSFDNNIRFKSLFTDYYIISNKTPSLHTYLAELGFTCETSVLSTYLEPGLTLDTVTLNYLKNYYEFVPVIGDVHHLHNPVSYLHSVVCCLDPTRILLSSSPHLGALITAMTGTISSLYPYRVYTNILYDLFPYHKQLPSSSSQSVFYVGDRRPSFHPARAIAVDELVTHCSSHFTIFDRTNNNMDWLNLLNSNNGLYLYAGINAQLSNHMIYPLLMGIPLLVDHETANNPYWRSYLVDGSTCIVFDKIKAYNLPNLLSLISTKQLKNISLNARILSSGLFSLAQSEQIYGISQVDRFDSVHTQIIDLFRQSLSMIPSDSHDVIVNICDIVQELNRLARFTIPIHIQTDSPLYSFLYQLSTIYSSIRIESFADSIGSSYLLSLNGLIIISASHLSLLQSLDNAFNHQWDKLSNPHFDPDILSNLLLDQDFPRFTQALIDKIVIYFPKYRPRGALALLVVDNSIINTQTNLFS